jgi:hypothetical protein
MWLTMTLVILKNDIYHFTGIILDVCIDKNQNFKEKIWLPYL